MSGPDVTRQGLVQVHQLLAQKISEKQARLILVLRSPGTQRTLQMEVDGKNLYRPELFLWPLDLSLSELEWRHHLPI